MGYIKHHKIIVLIENGNTQNFIHKKLMEETYCFVQPIPNYDRKWWYDEMYGLMLKCETPNW